MATMPAVRKIQAGEGLVIEDVEIPDPGPKEVVIKVEATSICGTDLQIYKGDGWIMDRMSPILPVTMVHRLADTQQDDLSTHPDNLKGVFNGGGSPGHFENQVDADTVGFFQNGFVELLVAPIFR